MALSTLVALADQLLALAGQRRLARMRAVATSRSASVAPLAVLLLQLLIGTLQFITLLPLRLPQ
jgi:hypothetical protein